MENNSVDCCVSQALLCVDTVLSQKCADQLLLAALEFLSSLGKIFVPPESQVILPFSSVAHGKSFYSLEDALSIFYLQDIHYF